MYVASVLFNVAQTVVCRCVAVCECVWGWGTLGLCECVSDV